MFYVISQQNQKFGSMFRTLHNTCSTTEVGNGVSFICRAAVLTDATASCCVTNGTWSGLHRRQHYLTQFLLKLQYSSSSNPPRLLWHIFCLLLPLLPSSPIISWLPLLLPTSSSPSSSGSSSLISSLSTGWAGPIPEYYLKLRTSLLQEYRHRNHVKIT